MEILYSSTHLNVISSILCLFLLHQCYDVNAKIPMPYSPIDSVAIDCGAYGNSSAPDGRTWIGDIGSKLSELQQLQHNGKRSVALKPSFHGSDISNPPIPYKTARISLSQFSYKFEVNPGQKFIRLHFFPASYPGFERSEALFTVKAGPYTLLSNFSPSLTADFMSSQYLVKEFCLNIKEANQELIISFFPSPAAYAFINGVEIVSMPAGLYYTHKTDPGAVVVGQDHRFYIGNSTAMETVQRLNIGGSPVTPIQDPGMYRSWSQDSKYLTAGSSVSPIITTIPVAYTSIPAYAAPQPVYQSVWSSTSSSKRENQMMISFTWKLPVDLGFRYLVRLHFCELEYGIKETGQREFSILINQQIAEACADVMEWSGGNGVAVYKDYVVMMEGDRMQGQCDLIIALQSHKSIDPILNGLEVFKLSNPDNNLAGLNPVPPLTVVAKSSKALKFQKSSSLPYIWNTIINRLIMFIIVVDIAVHYLCILAESSGKRNISNLSSPKATCRRFSMLEMQTATNNFEDSLIIGRGGFGKVYKGIIDQGATVVAIKRLNPESKQGAREFWTEIDMLSELRHNNLLTLLGYCNENAEMILVYEYMAQGTLADHLYNKNRRNQDGGIPGRPNWEQRLNICIGAARGLNFLHTGDPRIIHRDVKSTNILLDESWVAKISDFGLSKMGISNQSRSYISTEVKGTYGYLDPEYYQTKRLTRKSDVYAFGVVLLEVLCGRRPVDIELEEEQHSLALWAKQCIREGKVDQIIDPYLGTQISAGCLKLFADLAMVCLCKNPKSRPEMNDVLGMLELSLESQRSSSSSSFMQEEAVDTGETKHSSDLHLQQDRTLPSRKQSKYTVSNVVKTMTLILRGKDQNRQREKSRTSSSGSSLWSRSSWWPKAFRSRTNKTATILPDYCFGDIHRYSLDELIVATDKFSNRNILGRGVFGKVYKGCLPDGSLVAVKRRQEHALGGEHQFQTEVEFLDMAVHRNLLRLRGYCMTPERILVYPFMANGSVASCLRERGDSQPPLVWPIRKQIALDVATALVYLHEHCDPKIIHRDLKAGNVLLDEDFRAVVCDFGLAKLVDYKVSHVTTGVCGTVGHIAPEYFSTGQASIKTDVFGYGVMLLELITGQRAYDLARLANDEDVMLLDWIKKSMAEGRTFFIVDEDLRGNYVAEELEKLVQLALICTQDSPSSRPHMSEVVRMLQDDDDDCLVEMWDKFVQDDEVRRAKYNRLPDSTPCLAQDDEYFRLPDSTPCLAQDDENFRLPDSTPCLAQDDGSWSITLGSCQFQL